MSKIFTAEHFIKQQRFDEALPLLRTAVDADRTDVRAWLALGKTYFALNIFDEAFHAFAAVVAQDKKNTFALHSAARALYQLGNFKKAYAYASELTKVDPVNEDNLITRGLAAQKAGFLETAEQDYIKILEINPNNSDTLHNLATLKAARKEFPEAIQLFEKAYLLNPNNKAALGNVIYYARTICAWIMEKKYQAEIHDLGVSNGQTIAPFGMLCLDDDPRRHQSRSQNFWNAATLGIKRAYSHHRPNCKIRIGYFSSDVFDHATMHLFADVLKYHDRDRFEIYGYIIKNIKEDGITKESRLLFDVVKDVSLFTDKKIAEIARADAIDIAIDLKGHTSNSRPAIFAYGAGKIQINYLGYPGTIGSSTIDYIIADKYIIPEEDKKYYDENVLWMPNTYQPNRDSIAYPDIQLTRAQFGLPEAAPVLASLNAVYKVGLEEFLLWLEILRRHPTAVLWIYCEQEDAFLNLLQIAQQFNIADDRLVRAEPVAHDIHLARIKLADLFVDTFNVCAHTTASDALRAGLPVVTKYGNSFASRVASSILYSCGLDDWVAHSEQEYFEKIDQYLSADDLEKHKTEVRDAVAGSDLFKPSKYTKDLERLYLQAMARIQKPQERGADEMCAMGSSCKSFGRVENGISLFEEKLQ